MSRVDPDIESKARISIRLINETIQNNANEPSLALFRIQEHVQKTIPQMVQKRYEHINLQERMNGLVFDIEYGVDAVKALGTSNEHITNIIECLGNAVIISKNINAFRQQQIQQQLFEKKEGSILASLKN